MTKHIIWTNEEAIGLKQAISDPVPGALVVIDAEIAGHEKLQTGLAPGSAEVLITRDQDALAAISEALAVHGPVNALHLVSHGAPGRLHLGRAGLGAADLAQARETVATWTNYLTADAQISLYSCELARDSFVFLDMLADITARPVAGATSLVGSASQGGRWELDALTKGARNLPPWQDGAPIGFEGVLRRVTASNFDEFAAAVNDTSVTEIVLSANIIYDQSYFTTGTPLTIDRALSITQPELQNVTLRSAPGVTGTPTALLKLGPNAILELSGSQNFSMGLNNAFAGGAIDVGQGTLRAQNVQFIQNGQIGAATNLGFTGAIDVRGGTVQIDASSFTANVQRSGGAAINGEGLIEISNTSFSGNLSNDPATDFTSAPIGLGGAIALVNDPNTSDIPVLLIENSVFANNTAARGGVIADVNGGSQIAIFGSSFDTLNSALVDVNMPTGIFLNGASQQFVNADTQLLLYSQANGGTDLTISGNQFGQSAWDFAANGLLPGAFDLADVLQTYPAGYVPGPGVSFDRSAGPSIVATTAIASEAVSQREFMISLPSAAGADGVWIYFDVAPAFAGELAQAGSDYLIPLQSGSLELVSGTVYRAFVAAGETTRSFSLAVTEDLLVEGPENIAIKLVNPPFANGALDYVARPGATAQSVIEDNDIPASVGLRSIAFPTANEGVQFSDLVLEVGNSVSPATVSYTITPVTAQAEDFPTLTGQIEIPGGGSLPKLIPIPVDLVDDLITEDVETFRLTLNDGSGYFVTDVAREVVVSIAPSDADLLFEARLTTTGTGTVVEGDADRSLVIELVDPVTKLAKPAPAGGLVVDIATTGTALAGSDFGSLGSSVTIAAGQSSAVVPVITVDDTLIEGSETITVALDPASVRAAGRNYDVAPGFSSQTLTLVDNDRPASGVIIRQLQTSVSETGTTAEFEIRLTSQPTAPVVIGAVSSDFGEASLGNAVRFTPADWSVPQLLRIVGVDDPAVDGDQLVTITPVSASSDGAYNSLPLSAFTLIGPTGAPLSALTLTNVDNDGFAVLVSDITGGTSEADPTQLAQYQLQLSQATTGPVQVTLDGGSQVEISVDGGASFARGPIATLTGTLPQTVLVRALDDGFVEGAQSVAVRHSITSGTADYPVGAVIAPAEIAVADNDIPTASVVKTSNASEASAIRGQVAIQLDDKAPAGGLDINFSVAGTATAGTDYQALSGVLSLPFGASGGFIDIQPFLDDLDEIGGESVVVTLAPGEGYAIGASGQGTVNITDDDVAGVRITESGAATRISEGGVETYAVTLTSQPTADVSVAIAAPGLVTPDVSQLSFTPQNWRVPQIVTLSLADDDTPGGPRTETISHSVTSTDPLYQGLNADPVTIQIDDDDQGGIALLSGDGVAVAEDGTVVDTYTIQLLAPPAADVAIRIDPGPFLSVTAASLNANGEIVLNAGNLSEVVTVRAINDDIDFQNPIRTISHRVTTSDPFYASQTVPDLPVQVTENDSAGFLVVESNGVTAVLEGVQNSDSYTIRPTSQPQQPLTITIDSNGALNIDTGAGAATTPNAITFDASNWQVPQSIALTATTSDFIATDPQQIALQQSITTQSPEYAGQTLAPINVTINDDDTPGIVITQSGADTTVKEGGQTDTITVQLNSQPVSDVTISFETGSDLAAIAPITFTSGPGSNWNVPQTISLSALEDTVFDTETVNLGLTAASADPKYQGLTASQPVLVNDLATAEELASGLNDALSSINSLVRSTLDFEHPLFNLGSINPEFIQVFAQGLVDAVRGNAGPTSATELAAIMEGAIEGAFQGLNFAVDATVLPTITPTEVTFQISLGETFSTSAPLDGDFGLPALGLNIEGSIDPAFTYGLNLGIGVSKADGFFIDAAQTGITTNVAATLSEGFAATGNVGFLGVTATNRSNEAGESQTSAGVNFAATLNDLNANDNSTRVTLGDFKAATPASLFNVTFDASANLGLSLQANLGQDTVLPSFGFDLDGVWSGLTLDQTGKFQIGVAPQIAFNNIAIDTGSFISNFATPIIDKVDTIIAPFRPVLTLLNADLRVFKELKIDKIAGNTIDANNDGQTTLAEVISALPPPARVSITPFTTVLTEIDGYVQTLKGLVNDDSGNLVVDLGNYNVNLPTTGFDAKPTDPGFAAVKTGIQTGSTASETGTLTGQIDGSNSSTAKKNFLKQVATSDAVQFPILTDVSQIFGLLTGSDDASLVEITIPELSVGGSLDVGFDILDILEANFSGLAQISANFGFGFDTKGFADWAQDNFAPASSYKVLDGFFLSDLRDGEDIDELTAGIGFTGDLQVDALLAKGELSAGLEGTVSVDFRDTGEDLGTGDGKIRALSEIGRGSPADLFNLAGSINGFVNARAELFGAEIGSINLDEELFSIDYGQDGLTISSVFDGPISGAQVFFDANFNGIRDVDEPYTHSGTIAGTTDQGRFRLAIPLAIYDDNANGMIDPSEGRIVIVNGLDTDTGDAQRVPYTAAAGWSVASPLTLLAMELAPVDRAAVERALETALGLPAGFDLANGDPLAGIRAGNAEAAQVFAVKAQLQNLIILGANSLGPALDPSPTESFTNTFTAPSNDLRMSGAAQILVEIGKIVQAGGQINLTDAAQLTAILNAAATTIGATPAGIGAAISDLVARNAAIAAVAGTDDTARAAIAANVATSQADTSYNVTLGDVFGRLLGTSTPAPDTTAAAAKLAQALNLPAGTDISTFNTIQELAAGNSAAIQVYAKQTQVNATLVQLSDLAVGAGATNAEAASLTALVSTISGAPGAVDLTDATTVNALVAAVAPGLGQTAATAAATAISSANQEMQSIADTATTGSDLNQLRSQIAAVQTVAQDATADALKELAAGSRTPDSFTTLVELGKTTADNAIFAVTTAENATATGSLFAQTAALTSQSLQVTAVNGAAGNVASTIVLGSGATLTVAADGSYSYNPNGAFDALGGGEQALDSVDLTVATGSGTVAQAKLAVTITGISDAGQTIRGTSGDDLLVGGSGDDTLIGEQGNDTLRGLAGNDRLRGNEGADILEGGPGADILRGAEGLDFADYRSSPIGVTIDLAAGTGIGGDAEGDTLRGVDGVFGSQFNDTILGYDGSGVDSSGVFFTNELFGFGGDDLIDGRAGDDTLDGGAGNDTLMWNWGGGSDTIIGGDGTDQVILNLDDATTATTSLSFSVEGSVLVARAGQDIIRISGVENLRIVADAQGSEVIGEGALTQAGVARNTVFFDGGDGDDRFDGSGIEDVGVVLNGGGGNDTLLGGAEDDQIDAGEGDDTVSGGSGDDTLRTTRGDTADGGAGTDTYVGTGNVAQFEDGESLQVDDGRLRKVTPQRDGTIEVLLKDGTRFEIRSELTGRERDRVEVSDLDGGLRLSLAQAQAGAPVADGGNGTSRSDSIYGSDEADTLNGKAGNDLIDGNGGDDRIDGGSGRDYLRGEDGADHISGGADNDRIFGGRDNDKMQGEAGRDVLYGGAGNDYLSGGEDGDSLNGGAGDDLLAAGAGRFDKSTGGAGADWFIFREETHNGQKERDQILDFDIAVDKIDLGAADIDTVSKTGVGVKLVLSGDGDEIVFRGVDDFDAIMFGPAPEYEL